MLKLFSAVGLYKMLSIILEYNRVELKKQEMNVC